MSTAFADGPGCGSSASAAGGTYGYAGQEANADGAGVRATITSLVTPQVDAGHVAAWVGVGGLHDGLNGADQWLQAGLASVDGSVFVYVELLRSGIDPVRRLIRMDVAIDEPHRLSVTAIAGRTDWWRVFVDGEPVWVPLHLAGSLRHWNPVATAESFSHGSRGCNSFSFRFERVEVLRTPGGAWQPFVSIHRFLDRGYVLQRLQGGDTFGFLARSSS